MIKYFIILTAIFWAYPSDAQLVEHLKSRAALLVHADYNDFFFSENTNIIDSIIADYEITQLKSEGVLECYFFSVKPICIHCQKCEYILAYSNQEHRFFRLQGFRYNEFNEFYNLILLSSEDGNISGAIQKEKWNQIRKKIQIEGYDLEKAHLHYYKKYQNSLFDETSCFRKAVIREY